MRLSMTLAISLGMAASAAAQDGGKLAWRGKDKDEPAAAMAEAKRKGLAMMLFFTSEG